VDDLVTDRRNVVGKLRPGIQAIEKRGLLYLAENGNRSSSPAGVRRVAGAHFVIHPDLVREHYAIRKFGCEADEKQ